MASYGLRCWDAAGNLTIDVSDRLGRILGVLTTGGADGSISNNGFLQGTPFFVVTALGNIGSAANLPTSVTVSGNTMTWQYQSVVPADCIIHYGVF
jgi:hypothetical protein